VNLEQRQLENQFAPPAPGAQAHAIMQSVVTSSELAELWKVSSRWVMDKSRLLKDPLPCYKLDRRTVRFSLAEADQWFHRHHSSGRAGSLRRTQ
jgi:hypothetical protein